MALIPALADLPTDGTPGGGVNHELGKSQEDFRVSRNGTDTVISIMHTDKVPGHLLVSLMLWETPARPPCPSDVPAH